MQQTGPDIAYRGFRGAAELAAGTLSGAVPRTDGIAFDSPAGTLTYTDPHTGATGAYELATWTSPLVEPGFPIAGVVPSWTADTPAGSWIRVELRGADRAGRPTRWYDLGTWAADDADVRPSSRPGQADPDARVDADVVTVAPGREWTGWWLRVILLRAAGGDATPALWSAGAVATAPAAPAGPRPLGPSGPRDPAPPDGSGPRPPAPPDRAAPVRPRAVPVGTRAGTSAAWGTVLDVPRFSQRRHLDHHPHLDGGGRAWCSPTSTAMVMAFWGAVPAPADHAWVGPDDPAPWVDHAARRCYDHAYRGTGNWPFNTAYAGTFGLDAFVTRLRGLAEAELFVAAGIPLVISVTFRRGQVPGLDYDTGGHLLVVAGFTTDGEPVLNDPNWPTDAAVRRTVPRAALEAAWRGGSHGLTYVIRPAGVPLPPAPPQANW
ncbi:peptidase C39 family protein [Polymorphospora rubra]|uniref:Membrane protein n=1 Tax=Polymorphospora rubra TaxID=338584 RepID=A0A810N6Z8_9ACTN|nr:peptidase C39 family protein [Polymorphospora rubra]BCJ67195.1 membrane protein [Polymorphospora rubra]